MPSAHWNYFEVMFNMFNERHFKKLTSLPTFLLFVLTVFCFLDSVSVVVFFCFLSDGPLSLSLPPNEDRLRNKQRKELHRRRGSLLG